MSLSAKITAGSGAPAPATAQSSKIFQGTESVFWTERIMKAVLKAQRASTVLSSAERDWADRVPLISGRRIGFTSVSRLDIQPLLQRVQIELSAKLLRS